MFGDHFDVDPPLAVDQFSPPDVVNVLGPLGAVMRAFMVQPDLELVVSHVDEASTNAVRDRDLSSRRRVRPPPRTPLRPPMRRAGLDDETSACVGLVHRLHDPPFIEFCDRVVVPRNSRPSCRSRRVRPSAVYHRLAVTGRRHPRAAKTTGSHCVSCATSSY